MDTLGQRLKAKRVDKMMTQAQLAYSSGVSQGTISGLERDNLDPDKVLAGTLMRIAAVLDVSPVWLKTGLGDEKITAGGSLEAEMMTIFMSLDPSKQAAILAAAKALK